MSLNPAQVVVTDLHRRITGVSATIRNLVHHQRKEFRLQVWSKMPVAGFEPLTVSKLYKLLKQRPSDKPFHICHVRRNNEMQWALFFKYVLRCPIRIVFTSALLAEVVKAMVDFPSKFTDLGKDAVQQLGDEDFVTVHHGTDSWFRRRRSWMRQLPARARSRREGACVRSRS